jgi:predicted permease
MLDAVLLRMLPVKNPQELVEVRVQSKTGRSGSFINSYAELTTQQWDALRARQNVFSAIFAWAPDRINLSPGGEVRNVSGLWVSGNFFDVLGVRPALGRVFTPADDRRGCGLPGAVLSYPFWQHEYHEDPGVVGREISVNGKPLSIIGVSAPGFYGIAVGSSFDVALPICGISALNGEDNPLDRDYYWWLTAIGRLKSGVSEAQALSELNSFAPSLFADTLPKTFKGERAKEYQNFRFKLLPAGSGVSSLRNEYSSPLWLLLGISGLVLLIACGNLANLMLARASAREREIAVRLAVGASRTRIIRQLLAESLLLAVLGAGLGFALAQWLSRFLVGFLSTQGNALFLDLEPDWRVLGFTTAVATLTCILFGLAPAIRATRVSPQAAMKAGGRGATGAHERFGMRRALVAAQVSMSLVLLFGAMLFTRTLRNLTTVQAGFRESGILVADLDFTDLKVPEATRLDYKRQILDRVRSLPAVESAAEAIIVPISGNGMQDRVWLSKSEISTRKVSWFNYVSADFFKTLGTPLIAGRDFTDGETPTSPKVAIVNQEFARQLTGGENPVGKSFRREPTSLEPELDFQIVGVVATTKYQDLRDNPAPIIYMPAAQEPLQGTDIQMVIHSTGSLLDLTSQIRSLGMDLNPRLTINFQNFHTMIRDSLLQERLMATLSGFFGFLAALLATVGLYGVISYMVVRRTNEIGIRMALGADRSGVLLMILREAGGLLLAGVGVGVILSIAGAQTAKALLYGLKAYDPLTLLLAVVLLATVGALASALPAQRASRLEPMVALREE